MDDLQFDQFLNHLTNAINELKTSTTSSNYELGLKLDDVSRSLDEVNESIEPQNAAEVFVREFNKNFDTDAGKPEEIVDRQVYISGITPDAADMLSASSPSNKESLLSGVPVLGPIFDVARSVVGFVTNPLNILTLGGMAAGFRALTKFFGESDNMSFFGMSFSAMYDRLKKAFEPITNFFIKKNDNGDSLASLFIKELKSIMKGMFEFIWKQIDSTFGISDWVDGKKSSFNDFIKIAGSFMFKTKKTFDEEVANIRRISGKIETFFDTVNGVMNLLKPAESNLFGFPNFSPAKMLVGTMMEPITNELKTANGTLTRIEQILRSTPQARPQAVPNSTPNPSQQLTEQQPAQ